MTRAFLPAVLLFFFLPAFSQNVGIGTTSPLLPLHVSRNDSAVAVFENRTDLNPGVNTGIYFKTGSTKNMYTGGIRTIGETDLEARLGLYTRAANNINLLLERMSITNDGSVGIGTVNPATILHLKTNAGNLLTLENTQNLGTDITSGILFKTGSNTSSNTGAIRTIGESPVTSRLGFFTNQSNGSNNLVERMSLSPSGFLGLGLTDPQAKLHVRGSSAAIMVENNAAMAADVSTGLYFKTGSGSIYASGGMQSIGESGSAARLGLFANGSINGTSPQEWLSIMSSGQVGMNTTTPAMRLHIKAAESNLLLLENAQTLAANVSSALYFRSGSGANSYTGSIKTIGESATTARVGIFSGASTDANSLQERLSITNVGNVGIGTSSPSASAQLELVSTSKGFLPPRMKASQRDNIASPAAGLVVFCTDCGSDGGELQVHNGNNWRSMTGQVASGAFSFTIGADFMGGKLAYVLQPSDPGYDPNVTHGIIAASADVSAGTTWGCYNTALAGADNLALGTGLQNTLDIQAGCPTAGIAARVCTQYAVDGYDDWFLPSRDEIKKLYENRVAIGGFTTDFYWTSTEFSATHARSYSFANGAIDTSVSPKNTNLRVRPIRVF